MAGLNKAMIIGNLGQDPELKYMGNSGNSVLNISVATSSAWKDKQTGELKEETEWHKVVMFGNMAENAAKYLHKGSKIYVEGPLKTTKWEKDGITRYSTEITAKVLQYLDPKGSGGGQASGQIPQASPKPVEPQPVPADPAAAPANFDDDIPF